MIIAFASFDFLPGPSAGMNETCYNFANSGSGLPCLADKRRLNSFDSIPLWHTKPDVVFKRIDIKA